MPDPRAAKATFDYRGRAVLVTGGTRGIGEAVARAFARSGASVIATGADREEVAAFDPQGLEIEAWVLDVRDTAAVSALAASLECLDVVVTAAGKIVRGGREHEPEVFEDVVEVNLHGTHRIAQAVKSHLCRSGGSLITIASMLSTFGSARVPAYSSSKGGIVQLTRSLAVAWALDGVRVNAIAPGWIRTELTRPLQEDPATSDALMMRTPMQRWGEPADVAGAALFLASDAAEFITGAILPVDGGYSSA